MSIKVAVRYIREKASYRASGAMHKVIGQILSQTLGILDAPEELFLTIEGEALLKAGELGIDPDVQNPDFYPVLRKAIYQAVDEM